LLNSINFLPVAGVQLAAFKTKDELLFGFLFLPDLSGSFLPYVENTFKKKNSS
jgi:hypothetical protein